MSLIDFNIGLAKGQIKGNVKLYAGISYIIIILRVKFDYMRRIFILLIYFIINVSYKCHLFYTLLEDEEEEESSKVFVRNPGW